MRPPRPPLRQCSAHHSWHSRSGSYVSQVQADKFAARLIDLTGTPASPDEEAEFPITELSDDDLPLVVPELFSAGLLELKQSREAASNRIANYFQKTSAVD